MSRSRLPLFARQSLVPVLGFIALSLFVINFFTFLSHFFAPPRCTAGAGAKVEETRIIEMPSLHTRVIERHRLDRELQRAEAELRRVERKLRCIEQTTRRKEALARLHEARIRETSADVGRALNELTPPEAPVPVIQ